MAPKDNKVNISRSRNSTGPLAGRTIVVTRAEGQSADITTRLIDNGANVIHCPTIEFAEPIDPGPLSSAIKRLENFDWIVFTSANAAKFFSGRLKRLRTDSDSAVLGLVTCAIGPATARACLEAEIEPDLVAKESTSEGALAAIVDYAGGESELKGVRFLIPRARFTRDVLPKELSRLGAIVEAVEAYQTIKPNSDWSELAAVIEAGEIDVITFTSPSTVSNFASLLGVKSLSKLLENTVVACIGPVTAAAAAEHGLSNIVQPGTFTTDALVREIVRTLAGGRAKPQ